MHLFLAMDDKNEGLYLSWGEESIFRGIVFDASGSFATNRAE